VSDTHEIDPPQRISKFVYKPTFPFLTDPTRRRVHGKPRWSQQDRELKARGGDLDVGVLPGYVEAALNLIGFFVPALRAQTLGQSKQRPTVVGKASKVFAVDLFCRARAAGFEQDRAKIMSHGVEPVGRLAVDQPIFYRDGFAKLSNGGLGVFARSCNLSQFLGAENLWPLIGYQLEVE